MAIANPVDTYEGMAVPLYPNKGTVISQNTAAGGADLLTLSIGASATDDIANFRKGTTEVFSIEDGGNVVMTQGGAGDVGLKILRASAPSAHALKIADNGDGTTKQFAITKNYLPLFRVLTTRPTTGLTKGEMMVLFHGSKPYVGICSSTAGQQIKLVRAKTKTFGRSTA